MQVARLETATFRLQVRDATTWAIFSTEEQNNFRV